MSFYFFRRQYLIPFWMLVILVAFLVLMLQPSKTIQADATVSNYRTSWFGNTGSDVNTAVQSWIEKLIVKPDGSVLTEASWDEWHEGREKSIYKNGKRIGTHKETIDPYRVEIHGKHWKIEDLTFLGGKSVVQEETGCKITDAGTPNALAVTNNGQLMVADNGPRQYIRIYDVSSCHPRLVRTFGEEGGVFSPGKPQGVVAPLRFYGLNGVGMDAKGNICVGGQIVGGGGWIRCLSPNGHLLWQVYSMGWLSNPAADVTNDGKDFYSSSAMFKMNYSKTEPGQEAGSFPYKFTINIFKYPNDGRATVYYIDNNSPKFDLPAKVKSKKGAHYAVGPNGILYVKKCLGHKYLFGTGQNGPGMTGFKMDKDGIFAPMSLSSVDMHNSWGTHVDDNCNIWSIDEDSRRDIVMYKLQGVDSQGNLQYSSNATQRFHPPFADLNALERIHYDVAKDVLYITGFSNAKPKLYGWGQVGSTMYRWDGWLKGSRSVHRGYPIMFPHIKVPKSGGNPADGKEPEEDIEKSVGYQSISWAGDYAFASFGTRTPTGEKGVTSIYNLETGRRVGALQPKGVFFQSWLDITNANSAFKRSNGEYIVVVEDDALNKYLLYRWCPSGKCRQS
jgi:hypothetical protein